jgi:hypothetical protein
MVSHGSKLRKYTMRKINGKMVKVLVTWSQNRCKTCQRFLAKKEHDFCSIHKTLKEKSKRYYYSNLDERRLRSNIEYNSDKYNVGDII